MMRAQDEASVSSREAAEFIQNQRETDKEKGRDEEEYVQLEAEPVMLYDLLSKTNLLQYEETLQHMGVESATDLMELNIEDLTSGQIVPVVHARRLLRVAKEMQLASLGARSGPSSHKREDKSAEANSSGFAGKQESLEHGQEEVVEVQQGLSCLLAIDPSTSSAQNLQLLHCAMQLAAGKQDQIGEYLERMDGTKITYSLNKYVTQTKLGNPCAPYPSTKWIKLCEAARTAGYICPPYQDSLPGLELSRKWTSGRVIAEWLEQWSLFSLGVIWQRLATVMDLMSHARKVCAIAACETYLSVGEAEVVAMQYDHVVRRKMWDKYREAPSATVVNLYLSGEKEGLISEAERLAKVQTRSHKEVLGEKYCLKFGFGISCDSQRCRLRHACAFCNNKESGCLKSHAGRFGFQQQQQRALKGGKGDNKGYKGNAARREVTDRDRRERSRSQPRGRR